MHKGTLKTRCLCAVLPPINRVPVLRKASVSTWRLGLESFSNKDSTPLPDSIGTKEMLQDGFGDFYFL